MVSISLILFVSVSTLGNTVKGLHLPGKFPRCPLADKEINQCLKVAVQGAFGLLKKGLPAFNFPRLDPIDIPKMTIGEGTGTVHVIQNFNDLKLYGASKIRVDNVEFIRGQDGDKMIIDGFIKEIRLDSDYDLNGKILILPITGSGKCTIKLSNMTITLTVPTKHYTNNEKLYAHIDEFTVKLAPKKVEFDFQNLFNGNAELGKQMNIILNDQWKEVFSDVQGGYEEALGIIFKNLANQIYDNIPLNELYIM